MKLGHIFGVQVRQLMSDVQERHDQIRQLETSMLELHQVFLDMSILVADQGDTINSIDNWVTPPPPPCLLRAFTSAWQETWCLVWPHFSVAAPRNPPPGPDLNFNFFLATT